MAKQTGKISDRPKLEAAFAACRLYGAKLLTAKLDRLSRDAHFLLGLEKAGIDFIAADMPFANRLTIGVMALVAEEEGRAISGRTKEALAAAKKRGIKLGGSAVMFTASYWSFRRKRQHWAGRLYGGVQRREPQKWPRPSRRYRRAKGYRGGIKRSGHPGSQGRGVVRRTGGAGSVPPSLI